MYLFIYLGEEVVSPNTVVKQVPSGGWVTSSRLEQQVEGPWEDKAPRQLAVECEAEHQSLLHSPHHTLLITLVSQCYLLCVGVCVCVCNSLLRLPAGHPASLFPTEQAKSSLTNLRVGLKPHHTLHIEAARTQPLELHPIPSCC